MMAVLIYNDWFRIQTTTYILDSIAFLALVHSIPSWMIWSEIECRVHVALAAQKALKPISTSFAKQATGTKILLSQYIICEQGP